MVLCDYLGDLEIISNTLKAVCSQEKVILIYYLNNKITNRIKFLLKFKLRPAVITYKSKKPLQNLVLSLSDLEGII